MDAYISSTGDVNEVKADGDLTVRADVAEARIVAEAATASVSAGLVGLSGGGIGINNLVANSVDSRIDGNLLVETAGHVNVEADENAYLGGRAVSLAVSFSLGAAVGASDVINTAASTINASITGATVISRGQFDAGGRLVGDINVHANSDTDINNTDTAGISASLVGGYRESCLGGCAQHRRVPASAAPRSAPRTAPSGSSPRLTMPLRPRRWAARWGRSRWGP
ncbi:MAG: hypothetical protein M5U09_14720 [Gammaproteobacteria bacterium]|nr:hypothetical protein [Gammaproteobacteria bacterium]